MSKETALAALTGMPVPTPAPTVAESATVPATAKHLDSDRFAHLAKKEAELVRQRDEFKKEREAFEGGDKKKAQDALKIATEFEALRKSDPVAALKMIGYTETEIINWLAAQEQPELKPEELAAKAATDAVQEALKKRDEEEAKKQQAAIVERDAKIIAGFKSDIGKVIEANKDKYEYCAYHGPAAEQLIYEYVMAVVVDSKGTEIITADEAAQMVENYYEEEDKSMSTLKKRQPKEAPKPSEPVRTRTLDTPASSKPIAPAIQRTRSLSSAVTATSASVANRGSESREQKRERLIEALRNGTKL